MLFSMDEHEFISLDSTQNNDLIIIIHVYSKS